MVHHSSVPGTTCVFPGHHTTQAGILGFILLLPVALRTLTETGTFSIISVDMDLGLRNSMDMLSRKALILQRDVL
jgi:hypothetical protein